MRSEDVRSVLVDMAQQPSMQMGPVSTPPATRRRDFSPRPHQLSQGTRCGTWDLPTKPQVGSQKSLSIRAAQPTNVS